MILLLSVILPGCAVVPVTASNPVPGLTTVAIAPFFNLSAEPTVDGRRFALAYFSELQKTPGFQVVPVGIVERAIEDNELQMTSPDDAIKLARLLEVDAVVVGAVTDYNPYYPPQIGLQVRWYSPQDWKFCPGIPGGDPCTAGGTSQASSTAPREAAVVRGQSPVINPNTPIPSPGTVIISQLPGGAGSTTKSAEKPGIWPTRDRNSIAADPAPTTQPKSTKRDQSVRSVKFCEADGPQPLMSYTRFFDGADPKLVSSLRHYTAWRGDMRSGNWEAHLHRSEDFIRFVSHLMIVEMLSLHGGVIQTDYIWDIDWVKPLSPFP